MGQSLQAFSVGSQFEAQIAHDYLADNGIQCVVRCDEIPLQPGFTFGLEGWGSLMVTAQDAPKAQELLALIPGVGQADEKCSGETQSVSGAFKLQLPSVMGLGFICLGWFLFWEVIWLLPGSPDWLWTIGVLPLVITGMHLTLLLIFLTRGRTILREFKRAIPALLVAIVLVVLSPIWLLPSVTKWVVNGFFGLRKTFNWLAKLPEHLSD